MPTRVLIVDDSSDLARLYAMVLSAQGYDVETANEARWALEVARQRPPDLVITDLLMPEMNGLELITRLRSDLVPPLPKIVAISGFPALESDALTRGATLFMPKPIEGAELVDLVQSVMGARAPKQVTDQVASRRKERGEAAVRAVEVARRERPWADERLLFAMRLIARYFGEGFTALMLLIRGDGTLGVAASSDPERYPKDRAVDGVFAFTADVVQGGAVFVVPDIALLPSLQVREPDIHFTVSVPLVDEHQTAIGSLTLIRTSAAAFDAQDLGILQGFARAANDAFAGAPGRRLLAANGALRADAWSSFLGHELAHGSGRALSVSYLELLSDELSFARVEPILMSLCPRAMVAELAPNQLGLYVFANEQAVVEQRADEMVRRLSPKPGVRFAGTIVLPRYDPPRAASALLDLAAAELSAARREKVGTHLRAVLTPVRR